jgi:parallel beta-helix repeat protein
VAPGDDIGATLESLPPDSTICIAAGIHRVEAPLRPKPGQQLIGEKGTTLSGARVLTGFAPDGPVFSAPGYLSPEPATHGDCDIPGCADPQDVFLDGELLERVVSLDQMAPGTFYVDHGNNRVYLQDSPEGRMVEQAVAPAIISSDSRGVTVENMVIEKAAGIAQTAAVDGQGEDWVISFNEVRLNHGVGISCRNCKVTHNLIHHNGQLGVSGSEGFDQVFEENEISYNNTAGYAIGWEAGASKWVLTKNLVVRGNYVHDNFGYGLWTDYGNEGTTYQDNYVSANACSGIVHEISFRAVIENNTVFGNGYLDRESTVDGWSCGGIYVAASPGVEVTANRVVRNRNGIMAVQQARGEAPDGRKFEVEDLDVHDNQITMEVGWTGLVQDVGDHSFFTGRNNRFQRNRYHLQAHDAPRFAWMDSGVNPADWKGYGNDTRGKFDTAPIADPVPPTLEVGPR